MLNLPPSLTSLPLAGLAAILAMLALLLSLLALVRTPRPRHQLARLLQRDGIGPPLRLSALLEDLGRRVEGTESGMSTAMRQLQGVALTPGLVRFSAYEQGGPELSFVLALIDGRGDGAILTSLYGRGESRVYAKAVIGGAPVQDLSPEEEQALRLARQGARRPTGLDARPHGTLPH